MIQKNEFPILEYDFDSTEILKPNHGAEQLTLPEKCVFAFLGDTIDSYAAETGAAVAEHFETITKTYPIYVVKMTAKNSASVKPHWERPLRRSLWIVSLLAGAGKLLRQAHAAC